MLLKPVRVIATRRQVNFVFCVIVGIHVRRLLGLIILLFIVNGPKLTA